MIFSTEAYAGDCSFESASHISEMRHLGSVKSIDIRPYNYRKWVLNSIRILSDKKHNNIQSSQKKSFKAAIAVQYQFGFCEFNGKIRQNGDKKDHIVYLDGKPVQSLDVSLDTGNLANSVKFKLLIPHTRNGINEVFGTLLLRRLGFIAPKTSFVAVSLAGNSSYMLYQEKSAKEMLESLSRREGPIFKGDEKLLWSYGNYDWLELESVSASVLVNEEWAMKGETSAQITLSAYKRLQKSYSRYAYENKFHGSRISLNPNKSLEGRRIFSIFHLVVLGMNGDHALRPRNRRFYWNSLGPYFEPIYYDGNLRPDHDLTLEYPSDSDYSNLREEISSIDVNQVLDDISASIDEEFVKEFATLTLTKMHVARSIVRNMHLALQGNIRLLDEKVKSVTEDAGHFARDLTNHELASFIRGSALEKKLNLDVVDVNYLSSKGLFEIRCISQGDCTQEIIDSNELAELMSTSERRDRRIMVLPEVEKNQPLHESEVTRVGELNVFHSIGATVEFNESSKTIILRQARPEDWFMLRDESLDGVKIKMIGKKDSPLSLTNSQRFNTLGLTGCLNLYKVTFKDVGISIDGGACEDSVNIISSVGSIDKVEIRNAYSDAMDMDFSDVSVGHLLVSIAKNDCLDVSGGTYRIFRAKLEHCGDKGISIGEGSIFHGGDIRVEVAGIGISSKDQSNTKIESFFAASTFVCAQVGQKKQEFGDALLEMNEHNCDAGILNTEDSALILAEDFAE